MGIELTKAERNALPVPEPVYVCTGCDDASYEHNCREACELAWHPGCKDFRAGWYCTDCEDANASGPVLADVLAERVSK